MRIISTRLVQVCQYEDRRIRFKPGSVVVIGRNGSGKSNLLKMGLYANLTNDFRRNNKPKEQNIRYQAGADDKSFIETEWEHGGQRFTITRNLKGRDSLKAEALEKPLTKTAEIDAWLTKTLNRPNFKFLADNFVFVDQGELTRFLSDKSEDRAKGFAQLCGTVIAEDCWTAIGTQMTKDAPLTAAIVDNSDQLRLDVGNLQTTLDDTNEQGRKLDELLLLPQAREKLQAVVEQGVRRKGLLQQASEAKAAYLRCKSNQHHVKSKVDAAEQLLSDAKEAAENVSEKLVTVKSKLQTLDVRLKAYQGRKKIEEALAALVAPTPPKKDRPAATLLEETRTLVTETRAELNKVRRQLKYILEGGHAECDQCGTELAGMDHHSARLRGDSESLATKLSVAEGCSKQLADIEAVWVAYDGEQYFYKNRKGILAGQLQALGDAEPVDETDREKLLARKASYESKLAKLRYAQEEFDKASRPYVEAKGSMRTMLQNFRRLKAELDEIKVDKAAMLAAKAMLAKHDEARIRSATLKERRFSLERELKQKNADLDAVQERIAKTSKMRAWVDLLQEMRNVLHRNNLPRIVHEGYQQELLPDANELLGKFKNPFRVEAGKELSFVVEKPDGTTEAASCLSGGEKAVLALAVRWAVHSLSADGIEMLVLDEPTDGLDAANLQYLEAALPQLGAEARSRGLQVIVVTHESSLQSVFDQVIEVN